ncbi:MAG: hypothetical protein R3E08_09380 [Thiotrichaceae bacterium]
MNKIPPFVIKYVYDFYITDRMPAYLQIDMQGNLAGWGGRVQRYGLNNLVIGMSAVEHIPFLEGLPLTQATSLEFVSMNVDSRSAHVHIIPSNEIAWIVFVDMSGEYERHQQVQQQASELALLNYRYMQLIQEWKLPIKV